MLIAKLIVNCKVTLHYVALKTKITRKRKRDFPHCDAELKWRILDTAPKPTEC